MRNTQERHKPRERATLLKAKRKFPCSVPMLIMYPAVATTNVYKNMAMNNVIIETP